MKKSHLVKIIKEVLSEDGNVSGAVGPIATPFAFSKKGAGKNAATKASEKMLGMKTVKRPKHPSSTKLVDYLDELHYVTPNAFVSEDDMYKQDAVTYSENIGMQVVSKPKNPSKKALETYSDKKK